MRIRLFEEGEFHEEQDELSPYGDMDGIGDHSCVGAGGSRGCQGRRPGRGVAGSDRER